MITVDREIQDIDVAPGFVFYTRINPRNKNQVQLVRVSLDGQQKDVITTWKQGHQHYTIHQGMLYYLEEGTTFKSNGSPYVRYAFKRMKPDGNLTGKREIIRTIPLLAYGSETLVFKPFGMAYEKFDSEKIAEYVVVPYNPKQTTYTFEADRYNWYE